MKRENQVFKRIRVSPNYNLIINLNQGRWRIRVIFKYEFIINRIHMFSFFLYDIYICVRITAQIVVLVMICFPPYILVVNVNSKRH